MTDAAAPSPVASPALPASRRNNIIGAGLMVLSVMSFACMDATLKSLVGKHDVLALSWARNFAQIGYLVLLLPFVGPRQMLVTRRPWLQLARGLTLAGSSLFILMALRHMTLTQTYVAMLSAPLVAVAISGLVIGERTGLARWLWIILGFLGVIISLDPTAPAIGMFLIYAAGMALSLGINHVLTRVGSRVETPFAQLFYITAFALLFLSPVLLFAEQGLPPEVWPRMALAGAFGTAAHLLLILSLSRAPASVVSPMLYTQVVWAAILGYAAFGEIPGLNTIAGGLVVVASGIAILMLKPPPPPAMPASARPTAG